MSNNKTKTLNKKNCLYYHDLIDYIKNHNRDIMKIKVVTKNIYQKIFEESSKQHIITAKNLWKRQ